MPLREVIIQFIAFIMGLLLIFTVWLILLCFVVKAFSEEPAVECPIPEPTKLKYIQAIQAQLSPRYLNKLKHEYLRIRRNKLK